VLEHDDSNSELIEKNVGSLPDQYPIFQSEGVTASERYLHQLCKKSFLSLWSYVGIFRNQGNARGGDGKEVIDLLVVFGNVVILFSDKVCTYPQAPSDIAWKRWVKNTVFDGASQVFGAERWIRDFPNRLFLDRSCKQQLPLDIDPDQCRFYRIVVAHGAAAACIDHFGGGSGSLVVRPDVVGDQHWHGQNVDPFVIGQLNPAKGFVHVFDDVSLEIILSTLDTISDFTQYLDKKEAFILSGKLAYAMGEEQLVASYLSNMNVEGDHDFEHPPLGYDGIYFEAGRWTDFCAKPERARQIAANRGSYFWDNIIERFCANALSGTLYYTSGTGIAHTDIALRFLAREGRTRRRMLAGALMEILQSTKGWRKARLIFPSYSGDPYYVFLLLEPRDEKPYSEYREVRRNILNSYCHAVKIVCPDAKDIIGLATETAKSDGRSEDVIYLDAREWDSETDAWAREERTRLSIFQEVRKQEGRVDEYPDEQLRGSKGFGTRLLDVLLRRSTKRDK